MRFLRRAEDMDLYTTLFRIGMLWRIVYGTIRLIAGFLLLRVIGAPLAKIIYGILGHDLIESPGEVRMHLLHTILAHQSYTVTYFLAAYLIFWGVIDIVLSASLLRDKLWAFPVSIYLIWIFVFYEVFRVTHTHSLVLVTVILVDIGLIWLIRKEYQKELRRVQK